jgi:hypothetical protein
MPSLVLRKSTLILVCLVASTLVAASPGGVSAADSPISVSSVSASFFANPADSPEFNAGPATAVRFTQDFPDINFNPPPNTIPCNPAVNVNPSTVPFTDVVPQSDGSCKTIPATGNGQQAAGGELQSFQAVFTGQFQVSAAGPVTFNFFSDDGWILSLGPGANGVGQPTFVSGPTLNAPKVGVFTGYTVVGSYNVESLPSQSTLVINFPAGGRYPFELDYTNCCGTTATLTVLSNMAPIPPTTALALDVKGITDGGQVPQGKQRIDVATSGAQAQKVELLVDGQSRATSTNAPFGFDWDTTAETPGAHKVDIRGTDTTGGVIDKQFNLQVLGASAAPSAVAAASPIAVASPVAGITVVNSPPTETNNTNLFLFGGLGLLVLLALVGAALYYFLVYRKTPKRVPVAVVAAPVVAAPVANDNTEFIGKIPASDLTVVGARRPQVQLPTARLLVKPDREIQLSRSTDTVIGRDSTNNGFVDDRQVSRHHARITCVDGDFWIEDLNSLNGTRVNGAAISSRQKLADKDQINVGDTIITFAIEPN